MSMETGGSFWQAMMDLPPDKAPRDMLSAHEQHIFELEVDTETVLRDIDVPEDYRLARDKSDSASGV